MRFGIMEMQTSALVPPGLSPADAMQHIAGFSQARLIRDLAGYGFNLIELGGDLVLFFPQAFSPSDVEQLAAVKHELGLTFTIHLPLWSVEPSTPLKQVREGSVRAIVETIQAVRPLDPIVYVLHATGALAAEFYVMHLPDQARALLMRQFQGNARESVRAILAETGIPSNRLAIETVEFPFELMLEMAQELDLGICFDTGHVLTGFSGPVDFFQALDQCLPRLAQVHLHDAPWQGPEHTRGYGKDHQPLGAGDLDVGRLLDTLAKANYVGPIVFELTVEEVLASLETIRAIRPEYSPHPNRPPKTGRGN